MALAETAGWLVHAQACPPISRCAPGRQSCPAAPFRPDALDANGPRAAVGSEAGNRGVGGGGQSPKSRRRCRRCLLVAAALPACSDLHLPCRSGRLFIDEMWRPRRAARPAQRCHRSIFSEPSHRERADRLRCQNRLFVAAEKGGAALGCGRRPRRGGRRLPRRCKVSPGPRRHGCRTSLSERALHSARPFQLSVAKTSYSWIVVNRTVWIEATWRRRSTRT
jgi:hypothetical protein